MRGKQTVFLVESDSSIAESLCDCFDAAGMLCAHFTTAEAFLAEWRPERSGCLVADLRLPGMSGLDLQARLSEEARRLPVLLIASRPDAASVRRAFKAGAVDFLPKPFLDKELLEAVRQAFALDRERRAASKETDAVRERVARLKPRELEVIERVTQGMTSPEIAKQLCLSVVTVKLYRRLAMEKMEAASVAGLVKMWAKL